MRKIIVVKEEEDSDKVVEFHLEDEKIQVYIDGDILKVTSFKYPLHVLPRAANSVWIDSGHYPA